MILSSPNHFLLEDLLLELGQKCHRLPRCGVVGRSRISDLRQGEGRRVTEWGSSTHEVFSFNQP